MAKQLEKQFSEEFDFMKDIHEAEQNQMARGNLEYAAEMTTYPIMIGLGIVGVGRICYGLIQYFTN